MIKTPYNPQTGELGLPWDLSCEENFELNRSATQEFIDGICKTDTQYVDVSKTSHTLKDRPVFTPSADKAILLADGADVLTITKLPRGTTSFELLGPVMDSWTETRLKTDLTINVPGHYKLKITQWPYQDREIEFDAA